MADGNPSRTQVAVIGAGPGGYAAAFLAADLGLAVTLVTAEPRPGGVCLHRGCIPSKALLHIARLISETREARQVGVTFAEPRIDLERIRAWAKDEVIGRLAGGVEALCRRRKVTLVHARAAFLDSQTLALHEKGGSGEPPRTLGFEHAILATGSSPVIPEVLDIGDARVMDSTDALELPEIPETLLIIGGGYIGLEMGTVYAALGSRVTVVEMTDGLLPGADRDLVRPLRKRLAEQFEAIHLGTRVTRLSATQAGIAALLESEAGSREQVFDRALVAVGRRPNTQDLGLENTRVRLNPNGFVAVTREQRTDDPRIFAIGDVAGEPMLAHKASREAKVAAEVIAGHDAAFDNVVIPAIVFTDPEIAWCGLTETEAKAQQRNVKVVRFPWAASGRAVTLGRTEGTTKLLFDPESERLLGVGIVGVGAGELIAEGVLAIEMGAVARDLAETIHPHPTLAETIAESAEAFLGVATHLMHRGAAKR